MKSIIEYINETGSYAMYAGKNNTTDNFKELKKRISDYLDLNQRGKKIYKKGIDDEDTDKLMTELSEPKYQMSVVLTSSLPKIKNAKIIMKGKMYSVIQF